MRPFSIAWVVFFKGYSALGGICQQRRFAPTLKECMDTVQKLRALQHPVGVFFETENIFTLRNTALFTEERITGLDDSMTWREPNEES